LLSCSAAGTPRAASTATTVLVLSTSSCTARTPPPGDYAAELGPAGELREILDTHRAAGDTYAARDAWQHALDILTDLQHPDAEQLRTKLAALLRLVREGA
jgi:hypothetical protein